MTISRYQIRLERIHHASPARWTAVTVGSILLALITCGIVLLISGENPITVYRAMLNGALGDKYAFSETLVKMTPLLLTGLIRKMKARMQNRIGAPVLQPFYDAAKLLRKAETISETASWVFVWAPRVGLATALIAAALVPWSGLGVPPGTSYAADLLLVKVPEPCAGRRLRLGLGAWGLGLSGLLRTFLRLLGLLLALGLLLLFGLLVLFLFLVRHVLSLSPRP